MIKGNILKLKIICSSLEGKFLILVIVTIQFREFFGGCISIYYTSKYISLKNYASNKKGNKSNGNIEIIVQVNQKQQSSIIVYIG